MTPGIKVMTKVDNTDKKLSCETKIKKKPTLKGGNQNGVDKYF